MKTRITIALVAVLFTAPAFADHNERDEQGWKHGHWTEFPEDEGLLVAEGQHGWWIARKPDGTEEKTNFRNGEIVDE